MTTHMRYRVPRACTNIYFSNEHRAYTCMQSNLSNRLHLFFTDLAADPNSNSDVHVWIQWIQTNMKMPRFQFEASVPARNIYIIIFDYHSQ